MLDDLRKKMEASFDSLLRDFSGLRTGRASVSLLDNIMVEAYGNVVPLQQVGTITAPEARMLTVQVLGLFVGYADGCCYSKFSDRVESNGGWTVDPYSNS